MVRILVCAGSFSPTVGGLEVLLADLLPTLHDRGHRVLVITFQRSESESAIDDLDGITVHRLALRAPSGTSVPMAHARLARSFARIHAAFNPDIVHAHDAPLFARLHLTSSPRPTPLVFTAHTARPHPPSGDAAAALRQVLRDAAWTTAVSTPLLDTLRRLEPAIEDRSSVVHSGVPWISHAPIAPMPTPPTVLCLGRLVPEKGFALAMKAFAAAPHREIQTRMLIAGDGPEMRPLVQLADELGIGGRVDFLGARPHGEVPGLLSRATLVAMPSHREALPLVAIEAAMAGRPVVGTSVGGLPEVVADGRTGLLVPPGDARRFTSTLLRLLNDPPRCAELGAAARAVALKRFTLDACASAYEALFRRVVTERLVSPRRSEVHP